MTRPRLSIVAPCYDEESNLDALYGRVVAVAEAEVGDSFELVLVDDGSVDATALHLHILGTFKDGAEGSFDVEYLYDWVERMDALCECRAVSDSPARGADDWFSVQQELLTGYHGLDADGFRRVAARYGATHALVERSPTRPWRRPWDERAAADVAVVQPELPVLYEDDEYVIQAIVPASSPG